MHEPEKTYSLITIVVAVYGWLGHYDSVAGQFEGGQHNKWMKQELEHPFHVNEGKAYAKAVGDTMDWWRWVGMALSKKFNFCNRHGQAAFWVALGLLKLLFPNFG